MITVIDVGSKAKTPTSEGHVRNVLVPSEDGTRVHVAIKDVDAGKVCRVSPSERTQVVYILDGSGAIVTHTAAGKTTEHKAPRRAGVYLEPSEEATVTASDTPLVLL